MLDIEVMYADIDPATGKYRQVRVPLEDVATLQRDKVLFIIVSAIDPAPAGG